MTDFIIVAAINIFTFLIVLSTSRRRAFGIIVSFLLHTPLLLIDPVLFVIALSLSIIVIVSLLAYNV